MMRFWLPFFSIIILISLALYNDYQAANFPAIVIMVSLLFVMYFLITIINWRLLFFSTMIVLLLSADLLSEENLNIYLLLTSIFLCVNSIIWLRQNQFRLFVAFNFSFNLLWLYMHNLLQIEWIILGLMLLYPLLKINDLYQERVELQDTYDKLLSEFRIMKRQAHESERAARLEERTQIARDIHDSVGHKLTALLMKLQMLTMQEKKTEYEELKELASESLEETRHAVKQLQVEEHEGISTVLQLIRKLESESHIHLDFTLRQGVLSAQLTNQQNVALYRVLQESLTNAMRHAHSREVKVVLAINAVGNLAFTVKNRIHTTAKLEWGFGLSNMKKRVEELDGQINVYQNANEFIVDGFLPLEEKVI